MFDRAAPRYDLLNRLLTMGMDPGWRRRAVRSLRLPRGSLVLDLACGTGDLCRELERIGHRAVGLDFAEGMLARASTRTAAPLVRADVLRLPVPDSAADGVTCGFALRNVADIGGLFAEMRRVVRPGGRAAILEVDRPRFPPMRWGHGVYLRRVVPLVGGLLSDSEAYRYLPASFRFLPPREELRALLERHGLADVRQVPLSGGIAQLLVATREG